ncbi:hypothetical protein [Limnoglobus roseus]|uniref:hypothetical protein n=1 Tax=Limnoglobus roseus TaxID=2598579 RepID=UPI00143D85BF|nr:hypothetical protein [Limnoglobus roseus]
MPHAIALVNKRFARFAFKTLMKVFIGLILEDCAHGGILSNQYRQLSICGIGDLGGFAQIIRKDNLRGLHRQKRDDFRRRLQ